MIHRVAVGVPLFACAVLLGALLPVEVRDELQAEPVPPLSWCVVINGFTTLDFDSVPSFIYTPLANGGTQAVVNDGTRDVIKVTTLTYPEIKAWAMTDDAPECISPVVEEAP